MLRRTTEQWMDLFKERGALWLHDGNSKRPHALLTSGDHSDGFFNCELVTENPTLLDEVACDLVELLLQDSMSLFKVDRVVCPAMGAITLAHDMARHIGRRRDRACLIAYTEKVEKDNRTIMSFKRTSFSPGERTLIAEDVFTTGGSVGLVEAAVASSQCHSLPMVAAIVNRSGQKEVNGKKIISLIDRRMSRWKGEECPLCKQGSGAIRPKGAENWARLNAQY